MTFAGHRYAPGEMITGGDPGRLASMARLRMIEPAPIGKLPKKELLKLAADQGIQVDPHLRVGEIRTLLEGEN